MLGLYNRIWSVTWRSQILLIVLSVTIAGLAVLPLQYQKEIVNGLAGTMQRQQLLLLGAQYLGILMLSRALKFALQYRGSTLSESVIRRIRTRIYENKATEVDGKGGQRGTLVTMIAAEAEGVGSFVGDAIASPIMQIGTLISVVTYIAATQPYMGFLIIAVVLPQIIIVFSIQRRINANVEHRVKVLRRATGQIATEDIEHVAQAVIDDFDEIYETRRKIFLFKLSSGFVQNAITAMGTVSILVLGGLLVLEGRTDVGSVVAAWSGLTRVSEPWRELVNFYRSLSAERVKYDLLSAALQRPTAER